MFGCLFRHVNIQSVGDIDIQSKVLYLKRVLKGIFSDKGGGGGGGSHSNDHC